MTNIKSYPKTITETCCKTAIIFTHSPTFGYYTGICPECDTSIDIHEDHVTVRKEEYVSTWKSKLDGVAFPAMETFIPEDEAKEIIIDFILAIAKTRKTVNDKRAGIQIDLAKMAFNSALNVMDELGW